MKPFIEVMVYLEPYGKPEYHKRMDLDVELIRELNQSLDLPTPDADDLFFCTPSDIVNQIIDKREQYSKQIAKEITEAMEASFAENDRRDGYTKEQLK